MRQYLGAQAARQNKLVFLCLPFQELGFQEEAQAEKKERKQRPKAEAADPSDVRCSQRDRPKARKCRGGEAHETAFASLFKCPVKPLVPCTNVLPGMQISYKEEAYYGDLARVTRPVKVPRKLDDYEVEALREKNGVAVPGQAGEAVEAGDGKKRGPTDSGKGVRIQVGAW